MMMMLNFGYEQESLNRCHNLTITALAFSEVADVSAKSTSYCVHFPFIGKKEAISRLKIDNPRSKIKLL